MAIGAGVVAARRVYNNPGAFAHQQRYQSWQSRYDTNWSYYAGSALDSMAYWSAYRTENGLYYGTRNVYNPTRRLVDFYSGTIYPGILTADAKRFEDGTVIAIPFAEDTPRNLIDATATLWKWSNWHIGKDIMVTFAATTGECLVEVVDDLNNNKITFRPWYPGTVPDLVLDYRGNVKSYAIEYDYEEIVKEFVDGTRQIETHKFKKIVDEVSFRTYRDGQPYGYDGNPSEWENPYGFVPAVWVKHTDIGTAHGEPCMRYMSKWDELNALASHWLDQAHRVLQAPLLVTGDNVSTLKTETPADLMPTPTRPIKARTEIPILRGPVGADIIAANPPSGDVMAVIDHLIMEIEKDHPELTMHREMRKMSQVTGPAVTRLFGDVDIMVNKARSSYDTQQIKLTQMAIAIGGYRANNGDWGTSLSEDREVFLPFDLDSYEQGDLDYEIAARPLVPLGHYETIQTKRSEVALEREEIMLAQLKANPTPDGSMSGGMPSGAQATQPAAIKERMRSATEGSLATTNSPKP